VVGNTDTSYSTFSILMQPWKQDSHG